MGEYTQFYSLYTIKNGIFTGDIKLSEVIKCGNFGIGTFNNIDGELVVIDGKIYRTKADGTAEIVDNLDEKTPYAIVTEFQPEIEHNVAQLNFSDLIDEIDTMRSKLRESILCIEVAGIFKWVQTRAPEPSYPPYKDLADIIADQPSTTFDNINGNVVGFYTPEFLSALGVPDYHFHFIDESRGFGGHLQDLYLDEGVIKIQCVDEIKVVKPGGELRASSGV